MYHVHCTVYSEYTIHIQSITLVNTKIVAMKLEPDFEVFGGAESEYGVSFVGLALVFEILPPPPLYIKYRNFGFKNCI